jgi:hypothetical protein
VLQDFHFVHGYQNTVLPQSHPTGQPKTFKIQGVKKDTLKGGSKLHFLPSSAHKEKPLHRLSTISCNESAKFAKVALSNNDKFITNQLVKISPIFGRLSSVICKSSVGSISPIYLDNQSKSFCSNLDSIFFKLFSVFLFLSAAYFLISFSKSISLK